MRSRSNSVALLGFFCEIIFSDDPFYKWACGCCIQEVEVIDRLTAFNRQTEESSDSLKLSKGIGETIDLPSCQKFSYSPQAYAFRLSFTADSLVEARTPVG